MSTTKTFKQQDLKLNINRYCNVASAPLNDDETIDVIEFENAFLEKKFMRNLVTISSINYNNPTI